MKRRACKRRIIAGLVSLTLAITVTKGVSYASEDFSSIVQQWLNQAVEPIVTKHLTQLETDLDGVTAMIQDKVKEQVRLENERYESYKVEKGDLAIRELDTLRNTISKIESSNEAMASGIQLLSLTDIAEPTPHITEEIEKIIEEAKNKVEALINIE